MAFNPFRHFWLKLLSVGIATLLWVTVLGEHTVERGMRVPLEFQSVPETLEILGTPPSAVDVRVRGTSGLLSRLEPGEVVAILDLSAARPGSRLFHLRTDQVRVPYGVDVAQVVPATVALEFDRSASRSVPVMPSVDGQPAPGYVVNKITVDPQTVEVVGPESRIKQLTAATTETVAIDGAVSTVKDVVTVGVTDASLRLREPRSAVVVVDIVPASGTRDLDGVPVRTRNVGAGLRAEVQPTSVSVSLRGVGAALSEASADTVAVYVDLAGLGPGQYSLPIHVAPAAGLGLGAVRPATATVKIR